MFNQAKQHGVALISVLLIIVILLAVASRLLAGHSLTITQNQNVFASNQALQYALGAESMAREALRQDLTGGGPGVDHMNEVWAQQVLPFELDEGGFMEARLTDLHNCFNLNNLAGSAGKDATDQFKRMLSNLSVQPNLADAWIDWIDADSNVTGFGAEDSEYLIAEVPYRTSNQPVRDLSELNLMQNVTAEEIALVQPEVCVLPVGDTRINVNTAGLHTLAALDAGISPAVAEAVVSEVREYTTVDDFLSDSYRILSLRRLA